MLITCTIVGKKKKNIYFSKAWKFQLNTVFFSIHLLFFRDATINNIHSTKKLIQTFEIIYYFQSSGSQQYI